MKIGRIIYLSIIGVLLCLSVVVAQVAFRIERTMLSYTYTSRQIDRIVSPLYDEGIHQETVDGTFGFIRQEFGLSVPAQLYKYVVEAAVYGFTPEWFTRTAQRMLFNTQLVLNGKETSLSLPISINSFKLAFMDTVRSEFDTREYLEIDREITRMPSSFDLADEIPKETMVVLLKNLQRARFVLVICEYVVPGVLLLLCFVSRRIGSGLAAAGSGLLVGGAATAVTIGLWGGGASRSLANVVRNSVPKFLSWVDYGIKELLDELLYGMLPVCWAVIISGAALAALGFFLVFSKNDPEIRINVEH